MQKLIADYILQRSKENLVSGNLHPIVPPDVMSNYFAGALLTCIFWWLENDTGYTAEQMAKYYKKLVVMDRRLLLGI